ncbi:MAG: RdgB/HAM1 family non-canonical purine NTP pyrophosphatase [Bacteroidales bacterium]|nr:RdgB/HAM1 family non-canonical purine NTP pyrophosphatase [Bacteroidales bacterium]
MKIVFATQNRSKVREASEILGPGFELVVPADLGITEDIPETGDTLEENSLQKAMYIYERTKEACFSDDSGLEVDALGGAPGVHTARYAGESRSADANMDKLLRELELAGPDAPRTARFHTFATLILPGPEVHVFEGIMPGRIALGRSGRGGFGYDPIFIPDEADGRTAAELSEEEKNAISHRGKALRELADFLKGCHGNTCQ